MPSARAVLIVGHGTISDLADVAEFLRRIRRGRPASDELVAEIRRRYDVIGGSPLLAVTESLAKAVETRVARPVRVAMRFWDPLVSDVVSDLAQSGVKELVVLPVAPYSVPVYAEVVREAAAALGAAAPRVTAVAPYGSHPLLVRAHVQTLQELVREHDARETELVLTAHSLPTHVVASGDPYQREFEASARAITSALGVPGSVAYQSQGADGGEWLGPTLAETFSRIVREGRRKVIVAPVGFLADHVETLYDLDVEARAQAESLGLEFRRARALGADPALADALSAVVKEALQ
jgi:ferrochelatase